MSTAANTRVFKGAVLRVADGLGGWVDNSNVMSAPQIFGASSSKNSVTTAGDTLVVYHIGLPDPGTAQFEYLFDMDDDFQERIEVLADSGETVQFKYVMAEGTNDTVTYSGFVLDTPHVGEYNDKWKASLTIQLTTVPSVSTS